MRLSTRLGYDDGFVRAAERTVKLEEIGVDMVWVAGRTGSTRLRLGYLAARARHCVRLSSGNPIYSRTPALLAHRGGLDEIWTSDPGVGRRGPQVIEGWHGVPYDHPVPRTREIIEIVAWRGARGCATRTLLHAAAERSERVAKPIKMLTHPRSRPFRLPGVARRSRWELTAESRVGCRFLRTQQTAPRSGAPPG
jgi:hypothetical protein